MAPSAVDSARAELSAAAARGEGGRAALRQFSDCVDGFLQSLFADAAGSAGASLVVALGGYGRRQLCLHSDVDVLLLFDGEIGAAEEHLVRAILHPLWDARFSVGHQIRQVADFAELEIDNPEFLIALLDARAVAGDATLLDRIAARVHSPAARTRILDALKRLIGERHARFNDTLYQLEPDLKDAPGALRDIWGARAIAAMTDPALIDRGGADRARLDEAEEFLLRARSILHVEHKRNNNVLSHESQEQAARLMGYDGAPRQQVERLMGDYFRHARAVNRSLDWIGQHAPEPVAENVVRSRDGIRFVDVDRAEGHPESWLSLFQAALDTNTAVADGTLAWIQQRVDHRSADEFFPTPSDRAALLAFLKPRAGLYERLSEMHDCGLLGRIFPEFQAIFSRVVRDFYHRYTVDEHTLLTIKNLERLATRAVKGRERFGALLDDLVHPELLVLALLFHDVGKWRDQDDHSEESVRMAMTMTRRLQLPDGPTALIEFLIRHHTQMSRIAFRRDTEDPEIVRQLADLVGIEERLKMLCLLTLVDVDAVSPDTLTPWREELLWRLYVDTYNHLTLEYADERIDHEESGLRALIAGRPDDLTEAEIARFAEGLPRRYLKLFPHEQIYRHVRLSRDIRPDDIHADLKRKESLWELTVATLDKPFLFSNICGALSSFGMDISRGHAMTNPNGLVLDVCEFTDQEHFLELNATGKDQFLSVLAAVVSGQADVTERLRAREQSVLYRRRTGVTATPPVIHADNQSSRRYTILDLVADNALGLLHRVSRVISRHGCDVDLVLISTEGQKAIDVFHITRAGAKLTDAAIGELTADIHRTLEA
ncbi:MAG TPA: HD domain-containing protein [Vicinamibacterales bacterium]|nr:HD domain-containing protein [Vicinamibacterales bacterium]